MVATVVEKAFCVLELAKANSVTLVQRLFRIRYGKPPPTRQSIYDWSKRFQETGCLCKGKRSGRPPVSEETVERLRETFIGSPQEVDNTCKFRITDATTDCVENFAGSFKNDSL